MGKSILIISGKGGVGKSTLAAALAVTAAKKGRRTALLDADIGLRSLDMMLGLQDQVLFDLADCVGHRCSLKQALVPHPVYQDLRLVVGGQMARPKDFKPQDLKKLVRTLSASHDTLIIDGPAGLGRGVKNFAGLADDYVIVATPDPVSLRAAEKAAQVLMKSQCHPQLIINRVQRHLVEAGEVPAPQMLALGLDLPLLGVIEDDPWVYSGMLQGKTAAEQEVGGLPRIFEDILLRLEGVELPVKDLEKETRLRRFLRKVSQRL